mmetsp:Transcript_14180/g.18556  ORF Transcript_14180/g.18556 Transcript_14180/m.18556 type:complete len:203 (+) Transcript_14180:68-676(+)
MGVSTSMHIIFPKILLITRGETIDVNDLLNMYKMKSKDIDRSTMVTTSSFSKSEKKPDVEEYKSSEKVVSEQVKQTKLQIISDFKPIPRSLLVKLFNIEKIIKKIVSRSMSGKVIKRNDWERLKVQGVNLGSHLNSLVFTWVMQEKKESGVDYSQQISSTGRNLHIYGEALSSDISSYSSFVDQQVGSLTSSEETKSFHPMD